VGPDSPIAGENLRTTQVHERTGCLVLAIRRPDGTFTPNPAPDTRVTAGDVLIGVGTEEQLAALINYAGSR
jgi:voltage-gated potassium channel